MWYYEGKEFTSEMIGCNAGFVYLITDLENGKRYIGKKFFYSTRTKIIKGKKKKIKSESDWKEYYSSSKYIKNIIEDHGTDRFKREILLLCRTKSATNYHELRQQILNEVLESVDETGERMFYNENIALRYYASNIK